METITWKAEDENKRICMRWDAVVFYNLLKLSVHKFRRGDYVYFAEIRGERSFDCGTHASLDEAKKAAEREYRLMTDK